jgi:hypothetical protein
VLVFFSTGGGRVICDTGACHYFDRGAIFFAPLTTLGVFSRDLNLKFEF